MNKFKVGDWVTVKAEYSKGNSCEMGLVESVDENLVEVSFNGSPLTHLVHFSMIELKQESEELIVKPQTDWTKVAVDTKVVVWNVSFNKFKRHFAKFENGKVFTFNVGKTSYTDKENNITAWNNAELFE